MKRNASASAVRGDVPRFLVSGLRVSQRRELVRLLPEFTWAKVFAITDRTGTAVLISFPDGGIVCYPKAGVRVVTNAELERDPELHAAGKRSLHIPPTEVA